MDDEVSEGSSNVDGHPVTAHTALPLVSVRSRNGSGRENGSPGTGLRTLRYGVSPSMVIAAQ
jgi:hypothetical protein